MIRIDKLSVLQDNLVDQFVKRIAERPDQISTKELMDGLKIVQDIIERGQKQVEGVEQTPIIQINQQTNSVNIGDTQTNLNRESREKVKNAVLSLLNNLGKAPVEQPESEIVIDAEVNEND
jgi:gamma-glutamylcysteine synthetase